MVVAIGGNKIMVGQNKLDNEIHALNNKSMEINLAGLKGAAAVAEQQDSTYLLYSYISNKSLLHF